MEGQTNLIVNYLPQSLTDDEFHSMFESIGSLKSSKIVRDKATQYSYGFGFVDFETEDDAQRAITTLNGLQLQNKRIKVAFSRSGESIKGANLYITNIPKDLGAAELEELFVSYGAIIQCRVLTDTNSGQSKGVGFVLYSTREEAEAAIAGWDGQCVPGYKDTLNVKFADDNKGKAKGPPSVVKGQEAYDQQGGYSANGGGFGYGGPGGRGRGGRYGPMRNQGQNKFNRYNPMMGGYGNNAGGGGQPVAEEGGFILFVYNIGPYCNERELWQMFSPYGQVQKVNVIWDHSKDMGKGYGFVTMTNYHEAMNAIQNLNGYQYVDKPLQVSFKSSKA